MICQMCQTPIDDDETVRGNPIRLPSGEPICLGCHTDLQRMHREAKQEDSNQLK